MGEVKEGQGSLHGSFTHCKAMGEASKRRPGEYKHESLNTDLGALHKFYRGISVPERLRTHTGCTRIY